MRGLAKFDWQLSDAHRLELTYIHDDAKRDAYYSGYDYATRQRGSVVNSGEHYRNDPANNTGVGSTTTLLKYTGNLTDALTLTTVYGQLKSPHSNTFDGYDVYNPATAIPQVSSTPATRAPGITYGANQPISGNILPQGAEDTVKSFRIDLEYKLDVFNLLNKQTVQAINETYNSGTNVVNAGYGRVASYADPRSVRLTAEYNVKF
jgi:hypothetical protein